MPNTVKTLLYPFLAGIRLFSRFKRGKTLIFLLIMLGMFLFEGLLFFEIIYIPLFVKSLIQLYVLVGMLHVEFHFDDLNQNETHLKK